MSGASRRPESPGRASSLSAIGRAPCAPCAMVARLAWLLAPLLWSATLPARADTWSVWTENDQIAFVPAREERWYTQGLGVQRISPRGEQDHLVWSLTHQMYTPASTRVLDPQPADRPYAGILHAGLGGYRADALQRIDLGLTLGIIGPSAGAGGLQRGVHRLLHQPLPQGWRYQLPDQPWVQVWVSRVSRLYEMQAGRTDLLMRAALEVGSPRNVAHWGLALRTGALPQVPHWPGSPIAAAQATPHWMAYASAGVQGVFTDALLDGQPQDSSSSIQRRRSVLEASLGASWRLRPGVWIDTALFWRERDFDVPEGTGLPGAQRWGRLQLRWLSD
jgi:lipid A 3-O-deacylase